MLSFMKTFSSNYLLPHQVCECLNGGTCDSNGTCTCTKGFAGDLCDECDTGFKGEKCESCKEGFYDHDCKGTNSI